MRIVFYAFLSMCSLSMTPSGNDNFFQLYDLALCGDDKPLKKSQYWYGVYSNATIGEFLKKVDVRFLQETKASLTDTTHVRDKNGPALFYIGSTKNLKEKVVSRFGEGRQHQRTLYPGERHTLYFGGQSLEIFATGNVTDIEYCPVIDNYGVKLTSSIQDKRSVRQELYNEIESKGECGLVSIRWFGDLDDDQKVDFLLATSSSSGTQISLFISGMATEARYVNFADNFNYGNCY